jgi:serine/threonine protein kinase
VSVSRPSHAPDEPLPAELGEVLGGYRLDQVIGHGGMGCVYSASHVRLGRRAAVKVLKRSYAADTEYVARFFDEARVVNAIRHPNIIDIFDFIETETPLRVACIMELLEGPSLRQVVKQRPLNLLQAVNVMIQLVDALEAVHEIAVVHRDLKPDNLVIIGDLSTDLSRIPSMKVLDFGIAKVQVAGAERTTPGLVLGTPAYMSPEQVSGQKVSSASDVYSFGAVFFESLMGRRLFVGEPMQIFRSKLMGEIPPIDLPPDLPERDRVVHAIRACLPQEANERIRLPELRIALQAILDNLGAPGPVRHAPTRAFAVSGPKPTLTYAPQRTNPTPMPSASLLNDTVATYPGKIVEGESTGRGKLFAIAAIGFVLAAGIAYAVRIANQSEVVLEALPAPVSAPVQIEPKKAEPVKAEAPKADEAKAEPAKAEPTKADAAKTQEAKSDDPRPARSGDKKPKKSDASPKPERPVKEQKGPLKKDDMVPW